MRPAAATQPERILDTYVTLLVEGGVRHATIDAVARAAGLSKAGLLHHFHSRAELDAGLVGRLEVLVREDLEKMRTAPKGAAHYYLESSFCASDPLERAVVAATRLVQAGNGRAGQVLREARDGWYDLLVEQLGDPVLARLVLLAGDGVAYHTDITDDEDGFVRATSVDELAELIRRMNRQL